MSTQASMSLSGEADVPCFCSYYRCYQGPGGSTLQNPRTEREHRRLDRESGGEHRNNALILRHGKLTLQLCNRTQYSA